MWLSQKYNWKYEPFKALLLKKVPDPWSKVNIYNHLFAKFYHCLLPSQKKRYAYVFETNICFTA